MTNLKGSVFPELIPWLLFYGAVAVAVSLYLPRLLICHSSPSVLQLAATHHYIYDISITDTTHKLLLFPIAFLLVFRSNTAYGDLNLASLDAPLLRPPVFFDSILGREFQPSSATLQRFGQPASSEHTPLHSLYPKLPPPSCRTSCLSSEWDSCCLRLSCCCYCSSLDTALLVIHCSLQ